MGKTKALGLRREKKRIWELDFLRGLCIFLMVFDHFLMFCTILDQLFPEYASGADWFVGLHGFGSLYWHHEIRQYIREFIVSLFLLLAGVSMTLSKNNLLRSLQLVLVSGLITACTMLLETLPWFDYFSIYFGIIHLMAFSVLFCTLVNLVFRHGLAYLFFAAFFIVGFFLLDSASDLFIPDSFSPLWRDIVRVLAGFSPADRSIFFGSDFFPILPHTGVVFLGAFAGSALYRGKVSLLPRLDGVWNKGIGFLGRHTLPIYVLHQPVWFCLLFILAIRAGVPV